MHEILTETLACFLPDRAQDLSVHHVHLAVDTINKINIACKAGIVYSGHRLQLENPAAHECRRSCRYTKECLYILHKQLILQ